MQLAILGPLEIRGSVGGSPAIAARQQIVLAMLLLEAERVVAVDRLIDAVWHDRPPATARGQIQICISSLRRILAATGVTTSIVTRPPGYALYLGNAQFDLHEFNRCEERARRAVAEQRLDEAAAAYNTALSLWRGSPLAGINSPVIQTSAARLDECRMATLEDSIDLKLALGQYRSLIGELMGLVAEHPLRERLRGHLMLSLYHGGRKAEALETYRATRRMFIEELGIEPGEELRRLESVILSGDPPGEVVNVVPTAPEILQTTAGSDSERMNVSNRRVDLPHLLPTDIADFTGHGRLVSTLTETMRGGPGTVIALSGRAGTGKSSLAIHVAHRICDAYTDGQLYVNLDGAGMNPVTPADLLERFLRALGVVGSAIPDGQDERAEVYRNRIAGRRILILLDGATSEQQVIPLLPGSASCAVLVTSRLRLTGLTGARHYELGSLSQQDATDLLAAIVGYHRVAAEPSQVRRLAALCEELPLAIRIAGAKLAARPHWRIEQLNHRLALEEHRLDELQHGGLRLRTSIAVTYDALTDRAKRLFQLLSTLRTADFPSWVAAPLLDVPIEEAEELLENLADSRLLEAEPVTYGQTVQTRFRMHDIIRTFAREKHAAEPQDAQLDALHRVFAARLWLAENAYHREYGGYGTMIQGPAPRWAMPAAVTDRFVVNPLSWFELERQSILAEVRHAAEVGSDDHCWNLALLAVTLYEAHGYLGDWRTTHETALAAVRRTGNQLGQAAMLYSLGALSIVECDLEEAVEHLGTAVSLFHGLGHAHGEALAIRNLAFVNRVRGDLNTAQDQYEHSLVVLRAVGDQIGEAHVLSGMAQIHLDRDESAQAQHCLGVARSLAEEAGHRRVLAQVSHRLGDLCREQGDLDSADIHYQRVLNLTRPVGDRIGEVHALVGRSAVLARRGRYAEAMSLMSRAYALIEVTGDRLTTARVCYLLGTLHQENADPPRAADWFKRALRLFREVDVPLWVARTLLVYGDMQTEQGAGDSARASWQRGISALHGCNAHGVQEVLASLRARLEAAGSIPAMS